MKVGVIDCKMGNLISVFKAIKRLGFEVEISNKINFLKSADRLVLPGVGHFGNTMKNLKNLDLIKPLNDLVIGAKKPILGICLGMQLFSEFSEEGNVEGLGWIKGKTKKFDLDTKKFKIPHIGWNTLNLQKHDSFLKNSTENDQFYFVHSYYMNCENHDDIVAFTDYGQNFVAAIQKENIFGTQFHPEKSHDQGLEILKAFIDNNV